MCLRLTIFETASFTVRRDGRNIPAGEVPKEVFDFGLIVIEGPLMLFLTDPPDATFLKRPRRQFPDFIHPPRFSLQLVVQLLRLFLVPVPRDRLILFPDGVTK